MNTALTYVYTDASNYKQFEEIILKGEPTDELVERLENTLHDAEFFLPHQVGLEALQHRMIDEADFSPAGDDHVWHSLDQILESDKEAPHGVTFEELVKRFEKASSGPEGWDMMAEFDSVATFD